MPVMELTAKIRREDDMLWGEVVELPGCFASGSDVGELIDALEEAIGLYLNREGDEPVSAHLTSVGLEVDSLQPA